DRGPALRERLRLRGEELRTRLADRELTLVHVLVELRIGRSGRIVERDRLIHRSLADALETRCDAAAVVDGVRAATVLEIGTGADVPTDVGERRLSGVPRAAALVLPRARLADGCAELRACLVDRRRRLLVSVALRVCRQLSFDDRLATLL